MNRSSSSRERGDRLERSSDRNRPAVSKRSFSREKDEWEQRPAETVRRVASMTDERERARERERERERERAPIKDNGQCTHHSQLFLHLYCTLYKGLNTVCVVLL